MKVQREFKNSSSYWKFESLGVRVIESILYIHRVKHIERHICSHWDILQQIQECSGSWHYRLKVSKLTPALHVRFFFQVTVQIYLEHIFIFVSKVIIQYFFLQDSISIITNNNNKQNAFHASTLSTLPSLSRHPPKQRYTRQHATHTSMLPTQGRHTRQRATHQALHTHQHTTYRSTPPTLALIAHHFLNSTKTTHSIERVISKCFLHEFVTCFPLFMASYLAFKENGQPQSLLYSEICTVILVP